jgi:hypothetical protein
MASRYTGSPLGAEQKPDPAIKKNVIKARQSVKKANRAQSFVVAVSLAATLLTGLFFSEHDAQVAATAQLAASNAVVASVQQASATPTVAASALATR